MEKICVFKRSPWKALDKGAKRVTGRVLRRLLPSLNRTEVTEFGLILRGDVSGSRRRDGLMFISEINQHFC